jgi:hypothetical protein
VFATHQIVYLEAHQTRLYAEVIQTLEQRQMCWVRPLYLRCGAAESATGIPWTSIDECPITVQVLHDSPDLLWPIHHFQVALDTEVMLLLDQANHSPRPAGEAEKDTPQVVNQFMHRLWQSYSSLPMSEV